MVRQNGTSIFVSTVNSFRKRRPVAIVEVEAESMLIIYICTCIGIIILVAVVLLACCNPSSRKPSTPLHQIDCGHSVIY